MKCLEISSFFRKVINSDEMINYCHLNLLISLSNYILRPNCRKNIWNRSKWLKVTLHVCDFLHTFETYFKHLLVALLDTCLAVSIGSSWQILPKYPTWDLLASKHFCIHINKFMAINCNCYSLHAFLSVLDSFLGCLQNLIMFNKQLLSS